MNESNTKKACQKNSQTFVGGHLYKASAIAGHATTCSLSPSKRKFHLKRFSKLAVMPALIVALSACQKAPTKPALAPYDMWMASAEASIRAQNVASAKANFRKAAEADPKAKEPWRRLAELDFNTQDYGPAITEAQEVLKRDPMDSTAQSVLTVSGLRVAIDALGMIHSESDPKGPAHLEAAKVAQKLRETLGQDLLTPPKKKRKAVKSPGAAAADTRRGAAVIRGLSDSSDPFSALRADN
jgi:tetratricopeptide (TPR) repeat protein